MPDDLIIILSGYGVTSFVITALFVRLGRQCALKKTIRRHFYWFPLMPPVLLLWAILRATIGTICAIGGLIRRCFEILSGKKTYRRERIGPY